MKGGGDTCIYVGNDVEASIIGNVATDCTVGVEIVNSDNVIIRGNTVTGNGTGILAIVDPFNPRTETSDALIATNRIDEAGRDEYHGLDAKATIFTWSITTDIRANLLSARFSKRHPPRPGFFLGLLSGPR